MAKATAATTTKCRTMLRHNTAASRTVEGTSAGPDRGTSRADGDGRRSDQQPQCEDQPMTRPPDGAVSAVAASVVVTTPTRT